MNSTTQYRFSNEHGITGTLAADPTFGKTKKGEDYATFAIYCKAVDNEDSNKETRRNKKFDANNIPLITYVSVFDESLLDDVEALKKGYFVNFTYDNWNLKLGKDEETGDVKIYPSFVANSITVRHVPEQDKVSKSKNERETRDNKKRRQK